LTPEGPQSETASALDEHRPFVLGIDDATRRGYSLLAVGAMVVTALVLWAAGWSWHWLWLGPVVFFASVLVGRLTLLARHEARLRERVRRYFEAERLDLAALVLEAQAQGRYEFFVKLFSAARNR
jgi:hypothetical protein